MRARNYLKKAEMLEIFINQKQMEVSELYEIAKSPTISAELTEDHVQTSKDPHKWENHMAEISMLNSEISIAIVECIRERQKIAKQIESLDNPLHVKILSGKYLYKKRLSDIAKEEKYSYGHIRNEMIKALKIFENKFLAKNK